MTVEASESTWFSNAFEKLVGHIAQAVLGKEEVIRLTLTCLLSEGHLLLEDYPGTGKTSLARALANTVQGTQKRIQFTPDLLPTDVTGVTVFNQVNNRFEFHHGPIFANVVLADEINRASPKTQSALLEVMEEGRVTVDGKAYPAGTPFMVIATQNPIEQAGTYPLPEAQLDRFLMKTSLGYLDHQTTVALLGTAAVRDRAAAVGALITSKAIGDMAAMAARVYVDPSVLGYVSQLAEKTRPHVARQIRLGVSTRGCLAMVRCAKTWAIAHGRTFVRPDDVKELATPVLGHRILLTPDAAFAGQTPASVLDEIVSSVPPPTQRGVA